MSFGLRKEAETPNRRVLGSGIAGITRGSAEG